MENKAYVLVAVDSNEFLKAILGTNQYMWTKNVEDALRIPEQYYATSIGQLINKTTGIANRVAEITFTLNYVD